MAPYDDSFVRKCSEGYFSQDTLNESFQDTERQQDIPDAEKIFVNQSLDFSAITCFGFDMDYTLCEYISPQFDQLGCELTQEYLVDSLGYSPDILNIKYDPTFAVRGLWFDRTQGNLLKVDQFGEILQCFHGFRALNSAEIVEMYPGKIQNKDDERIFIMNTLFNLPESFLMAALINYFDENEEYEGTTEGWSRENVCLSFTELFQDVRSAVDDIHLRSLQLKKSCLENIEQFVRRDQRLPLMLEGIRQSGRATFLLTNSDWWYTNNIMKYLLGADWRSYFDWVIVEACKPKYFSAGTPLHLVDVTTGTLSPTVQSSEVPAGAVLRGGTAGQLTNLVRERVEGEILYCGDHLYADIIKCRQMTGWRTLLVVPELTMEVSTSHLTSGLLDHLLRLQALIADNPRLGELKCRLHETVTQFDRSFCQTGSLFRSGSSLSFFGAMVGRWAQLYTGSVCNILGYSLNHRFLMTPERLAHEIQTEPPQLNDKLFIDEDEGISTSK